MPKNALITHLETTFYLLAIRVLALCFPYPPKAIVDKKPHNTIYFTCYPQVRNAVGIALKEIGQRFDFKGSTAGIEMKDDSKLLLTADNDFKLKAVIDVLENKLIKRGVSIRFLDFGKVEPAAKGTVRQDVTILQGIPIDKARALVKVVKDAKLKVQVAIQGDQVRVSGKNKDDLQDCIALLKKNDQGLELQFTNYRN